MTNSELHERINRMAVLSDYTRQPMIEIQKKAVARLEAGAQREKLQLRVLKCAQLLSKFKLKMGQTILHNNVQYVLADVDGSGNPVGHRIKADGGINENDKVSLFRYRLERATVI